MPTIRDVAKRAGVSPVTVSRVVNNAGNVKAATRERVESAIEELNYLPSIAARSLRVKRTRTLALIVPDITNSFWTTVARGVEDAAQGRDYSVLLCNTDEDPAKQERYLSAIVSQGVDGVIIAPYDSDADNLAGLRRREIPTVIIDRRVHGWEVDSVIGDSLSGSFALVRHLINLGHRHIAAISGPPKASTAEDRIAGYCLALGEAGIPLDNTLIKRGEFRAASGERLTHQLLDQDRPPTAIFAANNAIALGAIDALGQRNLRVPQDMALVSFDDLPGLAPFFPFLTVGVQPAYDMGLNAAQLLFSRLDSEVNLQPRHVVLPVRLIIRHSCGSKLDDMESDTLSSSLLSSKSQGEGSLVKPVNLDRARELSVCVDGIAMPTPQTDPWESGNQRSDINRLLNTIRGETADRIPHLEYRINSKSVYEYVLEREPKSNPREMQACAGPIAPDDDVEFALRLGMDAVVCEFSWRPSHPAGRSTGALIRNWSDLDDLEPPPILADQLSCLEQYLRDAQGTGVGVIASFGSFFDGALEARGANRSTKPFTDNLPLLETLMDIILGHQERMMQAVCNRFGGDIALVTISDRIIHDSDLGIPLDKFIDLFDHRMRRLIAPAKEHGRLISMRIGGQVDKLLPTLAEIGFDAVHPTQPDQNDLGLVKRQAGTLALIGGMPTSLLNHGSRAEIKEAVADCCARFGPGGGYVLSSSTGILGEIPPENLVTMTRAVQRFGRYDSSDQPLLEQDRFDAKELVR